MIAADVGILVENFIGNFDIVRDCTDGTETIVSREYKPARNNERALERKKILVDNFFKDDSMMLRLSDVDIEDNNSILRFCNEYGLPCNNPYLRQEMTQYSYGGLDFSDEKQYELWDSYYRQDYMSKYTFCAFICSVKWILGVKAELEAYDKDPNEMLKNLISLIFYDFAELFQFAANTKISLEDWSEMHEERHTFTKKIQYEFLKTITFNREVIYKKSRNFFDELECFMISDSYKKLLPDDKNGILQWLELFRDKIAKQVKIPVDLYGNIKIEEKMVLDENLIDQMYKIAKFILIDVINERLHLVRPKLQSDTEQGYFSMWVCRSLQEAFYMEVFLVLSSKSLIRKCKNYECDKFFFVKNSNQNKRYCCDGCARLAAKRRARKRAKEAQNK